MKKQDYDKLNQEFFQIAKNIFSDKFSEYDPFVQQKINELYQKDENGDFIEHSPDKWKQFIDDASGKNELLSKVLQMAIAMHPKLTNVVADNLLNLSVLHIATVIKLCEREDLNTFIHKKAYNKISLSARHHFESAVFDTINQTTTLSKDICNELHNYQL